MMRRLYHCWSARMETHQRCPAWLCSCSCHAGDPDPLQHFRPEFFKDTHS